MRNIMKGIIMGPTLCLALLLLIMSETNRHQCEATAIAVENSTSFPNTTATTDGSNIIGNGNNSDTSFDGDHQNHPAPVSVPDVQPPKLENNNGSLPNISSSNGTEVTKVNPDEISNTTEHEPAKPCAIPNHPLLRKDDDDDEHKKNKVGNQGNVNGGTATTIKDQVHETALEKIGESLTGVVSTIKKTFTSIFSPGSGLGKSGEVDCYTNETSAGGVGNSTNASNTATAPNNLTSLPEVGTDQDHSQKLEEGGGVKLLIHPVSNNDTIPSHVNNTGTNETNVSSTSTTTMLPVSDKAEVSTAAPAPAAP